MKHQKYLKAGIWFSILGLSAAAYGFYANQGTQLWYDVALIVKGLTLTFVGIVVIAISLFYSRKSKGI